LICKFNLTVRDEFRGIVGEERISKDDLRSTIDLIIRGRPTAIEESKASCNLEKLF